MEKEAFRRYLLPVLMDLIASVFYAVSINVFTVQADFAPGGVSGLAILLNYLCRIPVGTASILINIPIILFTFRRLGAGFFLRSLKTMVISAAATDLTASVMPRFAGNRLVSALCAGLFMGIAVGIIFSQDSSFGSSDFITMAVKKARPDFSVGVIAWVVNASVILIAAIVFRQALAVVLGLLHTLTDCVVLDAVLKGIARHRLRRTQPKPHAFP